MPNAMNAQEKLRWMIYALRASISLDWGKLAVKALASEEKRTITDRRMAGTKALKEIKNTLERMPSV